MTLDLTGTQYQFYCSFKSEHFWKIQILIILTLHAHAQAALVQFHHRHRIGQSSLLPQPGPPLCAHTREARKLSRKAKREKLSKDRCSRMCEITGHVSCRCCCTSNTEPSQPLVDSTSFKQSYILHDASMTVSLSLYIEIHYVFIGWSRRASRTKYVTVDVFVPVQPRRRSALVWH